MKLVPIKIPLIHNKGIPKEHVKHIDKSKCFKIVFNIFHCYQKKKNNEKDLKTICGVTQRVILCTLLLTLLLSLLARSTP